MSSHSLPGLYVHIPFCRQKCAYCDFCSFAGLDDLHAPYVNALLYELSRSSSRWSKHAFGTIYIGGGTPTVLPPREIGRFLAACRELLDCSHVTEITVEANPGTVDAGTLGELRMCGVNRLSLGVQSFDDAELSLLGRIHTADEAQGAYYAARQAGFDNVSLDLIFGLPEQTVSQWRKSLELAISLRPEHLSLYALTLEPGTLLYSWIDSGELPKPDEDQVAQMYELSERLLDAAGYSHYEISNWARRRPQDDRQGLPGLASRHNLVYWHNAPYLGLGAAAYSYDGLDRSANVADPAEYIQRAQMKQEFVAESEEVDAQRELEDTLMLGLRLLVGVRWNELERRFGRDIRELYADRIDELVANDLLLVDELGMRLSPRGHLLGNQVFGAFIDL